MRDAKTLLDDLRSELRTDFCVGNTRLSAKLWIFFPQLVVILPDDFQGQMLSAADPAPVDVGSSFVLSSVMVMLLFYILLLTYLRFAVCVLLPQGVVATEYSSRLLCVLLFVRQFVLFICMPWSKPHKPMYCHTLQKISY